LAFRGTGGLESTSGLESGGWTLGKRAGKIETMDLVHRVVEKRLTYLHPEKLTLLMATVERLNADGVAGNLAEFGVALGGSAICIASQLVAGRNFYGFDNFDLIPRPEPIDGERPNSRYAVIKSGLSPGIGGDRYYGYEPDRLGVVSRNFAEFGLCVDDERIVLIKGLFEETLPRYLKEPIAFAHIDCDWYSPVRFCLHQLYPLLPDNGTIIIDDYNHWEGCTKATDEFCAAFPQITIAPGPTCAVLVKRPA
jgi:O-methyltransferase